MNIFFQKDEYYTLLSKISVLIPQMNEHFQNCSNIFSSIYKMYTWKYTLTICQILPAFKMPEIQNCQILVDNRWQEQLPEAEETQRLLNFSQRELVYLLWFKKRSPREKGDWKGSEGVWKGSEGVWSGLKPPFAILLMSQILI